jgi:hypothetical protein
MLEAVVAVVVLLGWVDLVAVEVVAQEVQMLYLLLVGFLILAVVGAGAQVAPL